MAKYFGKVGFIVTEEKAAGVFEEVMTIREYYGDVIRINKRWDQSSERENDDLNINNQISILADTYAYEHLYGLRYIEWLGIKWKINSVDVEYPRLILSIGGVYNGDAEDETGTSDGV